MSNLPPNKDLQPILENHKQGLIKKIAAAYKQLNFPISESDKVSVQNQIDSLEQELQDVNDKLASSLNDGNPSNQTTYPKEVLPQIIFKPCKIKDVSVDELKQVSSKVDILLLTVNEWERKALLSEMTPLKEQDSILQGALSAITYRIGMFGNYCAAYTESTMGSGGRQGVTLTAERAINELKPKAVFLLGIAFGIDRTKQKLGDVLIAESISPYEFQKVNETFSIHRGQSIPCGHILSERFRTRRIDWNPTYNEQSLDVKVHQGLVLSGEKVVNNREFRDELVKAFPTAIGGEMEGAGAYAAVTPPIEVILIKSICDWADGDKNDDAQPFAAFTAISLAKHVLSKPDVLHPLIKNNEQNNTENF